MKRPVSTWIPLLATLCLASPALSSDVAGHLELTEDVTRGALRIADPDGALVECPLQHTEVQADVSGFIARVRVKQSFVNPLDEPIEAVYVFPLSSSGAVDEMTMVIGTRRIVGVIERRDDARRIYENAMARGATASLLEQERPNIFTQSVANIPPRGRVDIEIGYVDVLAYDSGAYEFRFPMVVGPRFIPGAPTSALPDTPHELQGRGGAAEPRGGQDPTGSGWSPDTTRVPDASRITPLVLRPGLRTGHDVSLKVRLDAGVKIENLVSANHEVETERPDARRASVEIAAADTLPNKDFVLRYAVAGERPEVGLLAHSSAGGAGTFLLMLQPKRLDEELAKAPPREVCFLIDVSGSMSGQPTAKVREIMERFFERAKPEDRIQVVTFASRAERLFSGYVPASKANVERALGFTRSLRGGGGTQMLEGIRAVLQDPVDPERVRIVMLLSDGYIGNEAEIIREVGQRAGDQLRFWSLGVGSSPNQYLIDGVAAQGGGDSAVVGLSDDTRELVGRITDRIHRSQLADIQIDWGGLDVFETYPAQLPDLWAGQPVFVLGRYRGHGEATIELRGSVEGQPTSFRKRVDLPASEPGHAALASAWARRKIADLDAQRIVYGAQELVEDITALALRYRLMSAYTSFVAVDAETLGDRREGRPPLRMLVPVPLPQGTQFEGLFGEGERESYEVDEVMALASVADRQPARKVERSKLAATPAPGIFQPARTAGFAGAMNAPAPVVAEREAFARQVPAGLASPAMAQATSSLTARAKIDSRELGRRLDRDALAQRRLLDPFVSRARVALKRRDWREARRQLQIAYLLGAGGSLRQDWEEMERVAHRHAVTALPALNQKVGVEIRNQSLRESLAVLSKTAGVEIRLAPGSLDDVRDAFGHSEPRIAHLDLRGATLAKALSWSVADLGLEWAVVGQGVTVTSARRAPGITAWAYALADLAPDAAAAAQIASEVRRLLEAGDDLAERRAAVTLGTNLVVRTDASGHETTARFLKTLTDVGAPIEPRLTGLRQRVAAHWQGRADRLRARTRARREQEVARRSWQLIASTRSVSADTAAVAALYEMASSPAGLSGLDPDLHARLLFATCVARAAHPDDTPLADLARLAFRSIPESGPSPSSQAIVYRRLLGRLPASLVPRSPGAGEDAFELDVRQRELVDELLRPSGEVGALLGGARGTPDEDLVLLVGLKAARSGPGAWNDFRVRIANGGLSLSGPALRALASLEYVASLLSEERDVAQLTKARGTSPRAAASGAGVALGVVAATALLALRLR